MKRLLAFAVIGLLMSLAAPASASTRVYVGINLSLRAGPDIGYPRVMVVPAGAYISVQGCLGDWSWCDVIIDGHRGWVAATYLQYYYGDSWVYLPSYGPRIGVPVVTFVLGTYWGDHYRSRPWYRERERWMRHPPSHRRPQRSQYYRPLPPPRSGPAEPRPVRRMDDRNTVRSRQVERNTVRTREVERNTVRTRQMDQRPAPTRATPRAQPRSTPPAQKQREKQKDRKRDHRGGGPQQ